MSRDRGARWAAVYVAQIALVALLYFIAAKVGFHLAFQTKQVTAVWPPTAIAFTSYLLLGYRAWPGVYLGAFLANALADERLFTAAGIAVGNTLAGIVGVALMRRWIGPMSPTLDRLQEVFGIALLGAAAGSVVSATNGVLNLALSSLIPWSAFGSVFWVWWMGDAMGVLLVAPFLITWTARPWPRYGVFRAFELATLFTLLAIVCNLAFAGHLLQNGTHFRFAYAVFPFVMWATLRFGQREGSLAVVFISILAIWGTTHDTGPFAQGTLDERLIYLEVFVATVAMTALTLGATAAERRRAEEALRAANEGLEHRVEERTKELGATNAELTRKNEEVQAFVYIVSHDLRAPLLNVQGFSKELEMSCHDLRAKVQAARSIDELQKAAAPTLTKDIPDALRYITASTSKFQRLIDALLALSRMGRQEYRTERVNVALLLSATLDSLRQSIDKSGAEVSIATVPDAQGDPTAIGQVFSNLIGNTLKYLRPGTPGKVSVGGENQNGMAHYWVKDNGAGIPESAQVRLFQVFQRFHPELASGEGMGLAIVKRVVERHGGRVWAESREGVGSTFHLTLPAASSSEGRT